MLDVVEIDLSTYFCVCMKCVNGSFLRRAFLCLGNSAKSFIC